MHEDLFAPLDINVLDITESPPVSISFWEDVWLRFKKHRAALTGLIILCLLALFAIFGPLITPHPYYATYLEFKNEAPSSRFFFGTDDLGRDVFARVACGARISLFVGMSAALIDLVLGVLWGSLCACAKPSVDIVLMRFADILYSIPHLLVIILLMVVMGTGLIPIIIALALTGWVGMARIVRGELFQLREQEYVLAAKALGARKTRILFKHLLPNAMGPIIVTMMLTIPVAIFTEAFLSFLGLGVQAPIASWGTMASDGLPAMRYYPWRLFFPAAFISVTMLALNLVGDGLRDAIDPKLRR